MAKLDDKLTPVSPSEVFDSLAVAWQKTFHEEPNRKSLLVLLAQWALETGRGKSMHCFNLGNVKSSGQSGDWCFFRCNEIIKGKIEWFDPEHPQTRFRAFQTLDEGALDYLTTLHKRFEKSWPAVLAGDPVAFVHALKLQNYFTANEASYTKTAVSLFNEFDRTLHSAEAADLYTTLGIQTALKGLGFFPNLPDGVDGPVTRAAIIGFQRAHGLVADGVVGALTRQALAEAVRP